MMKRATVLRSNRRMRAADQRARRMRARPAAHTIAMYVSRQNILQGPGREWARERERGWGGAGREGGEGCCVRGLRHLSGNGPAGQQASREGREGRLAAAQQQLGGVAHGGCAPYRDALRTHQEAQQPGHDRAGARGLGVRRQQPAATEQDGFFIK